MNRITYLKSKFQNQGCTKSELEELYYLIQNEGLKGELDQMIIDAWQSKEDFKSLEIEEAENLLRSTKSRIEFQSKPTITWKTWYRIAASILLVGSLTWLYINQTSKEKVMDIEWITKSTNNGQRARISLVDGTVVTLNVGTTISYPRYFSDHSRKVKLHGEAFFEVARDTLKPFTVESEKVLTTVLGTSFNVKSYGNKSTEVTVATGKVKVEFSPKALAEEAILLPSDQVRMDLDSHTLSVSKVDLDKYLAWRENELYFDSEKFEDVIKTLERWYNVKIALKNDVVNNCLIHAKYKNEVLSNVLDGLRLLVNFNYKILDDQTIEITGISCEQ